MANIAFSLCAAAASLIVSVFAAVKGIWPVAIVYALLFLGFLLRAHLGRRRDQRR